MLALGGLAGGCFDRKCGPNQERVKGYCLCKAGFTANEDVDCVKDKPKPADPGDSGAGSDAAAADPAPAGGCDDVTGLGCACSSDEDCAGKAADYCVIDNPNTPGEMRACLLQGCDIPGKECPSTMQCCSFFPAPKGTVCLPEDTKCPFD